MNNTSAFRFTLIPAGIRERRGFLESRFWRRFSRHRLALLGSLLLLVLVFCAVAAPIIAPYEPHKVNVKAIKKPPSADHWLGTDGAGRDVLSRLIYGSRISLSVGLVAARIAIAIGTLLGLFSGFYGGRVDFWIMRFTDVVMINDRSKDLGKANIEWGKGLWRDMFEA